jgi:hypothetical protein
MKTESFIFEKPKALPQLYMGYKSVSVLTVWYVKTIGTGSWGRHEPAVD